MFIIACRATCIFGSGWLTEGSGLDAEGAVAAASAAVSPLGFSGREGYKLTVPGFSVGFVVMFTALASFSLTTVHSSSKAGELLLSTSAFLESFCSGLYPSSTSEVEEDELLDDEFEDCALALLAVPSGVSTLTWTSIPKGSRAAATKLPTFVRYSADPVMVANWSNAAFMASWPEEEAAPVAPVSASFWASG